ncbi:MAG TPA: TonB-dependent receptor, partial [Alteromonas macleodii]|nr:TonB-dependent receptor [Alteromonas macleodii]
MPTRISTKSSSQNVAQSPTHQLARSPFALAIIASAVTYAFSSAAEANDAMDHYEVIEVQGATPLSANSNNSAVFGNVQTLTQDDIEGSVNRSLPELLKTQLASVNLNDVQNNPFQP